MAQGQLRIEKMYAFIALDPEDNTEGVIAFAGPGGMAMPMVGADTERVEQLRPIAEELAKANDMKVTLCLFENRVEVETIGESDGSEDR